MRRADRLFQIVNFLRSRRRAVTAQRIADEFEICVRTVYRDIKDLMTSGVPIHGEAGIGYMFDKSYDLPPLSFDIEEIEALVLGASIVSTWTDKEFSKASKRAIAKIKNSLPSKYKDMLDDTALFSPPSAAKVPIVVNFSEIRQAIRTKHKIQFDYKTESKKKSSRTIRPMGLAFFAPVWLLIGWCELRKEFRNFRLDRMTKCTLLDSTFSDE